MKRELNSSKTLAPVALSLIEDPDNSFADLGSIDNGDVYRFGVDPETGDFLMVVGFGDGGEVTYQHFLAGTCDRADTIVFAIAEHIREALFAFEFYEGHRPDVALSGPISDAGIEEAADADNLEYAFVEALSQLLLEYGVDHTEVAEGVEK